MLQIRPFKPTAADYAVTVAVSKAVWPDEPITIRQLQYEDSSWKRGYLRQRLVAELDGAVIAVACYFENYWQYQPGKYDVDIIVHPAYQGRGIGKIIYNHILETLEHLEPKVTSIVSSTREDKPRGLRFLKERGFEVIMHWARSRLNLATFEPARFRAVTTHVAQQDIRILSLKELQVLQPDWQRRYYDLDHIAGQDTPSPDPMSEVPFEQFVAQTFGHPYFMPEMYFVAVDGEGQWLGVTELGDREDPEHLFTPFTSVHPSYRRRGIATLLKLNAAVFAQQYGAKTITAVNEVNNPMYQINLALGFEPLPAGLTMKKVI